MTHTILRTNLLISPSSPTWSDRYGDRHRLERITDFPRGVAPPSKVRLYWRRDHYVLQWWDPGAKRTLSDRVEGDLVAALTRIRVIEVRLQERGTCHNNGHRRLTFADLTEAFQKNLRQRADADEIDIRTVGRYASALAYLRHFSEQPSIQSRYPHPGRVDRDFVLEFLAFLKTRVVTRNGRAQGVAGRLTSVEYILATAHAAFTWAADPDRGALLASDFRNPFRGQAGAIRSRSAGPCAAPPITIPMAVDWLQVCDDCQRRLFVPLM